MVTLVSKFICRANLKAHSTLMYSKFADKEIQRYHGECLFFAIFKPRLV